MIFSFAGAFSAEPGENTMTQAQAIQEFKDNLYIGDWVPAAATEEQIRTMAENGIEYTFLWNFSYDNPNCVNTLEDCAKYGIKVILKDHKIEIYQRSGAVLKEKENMTAEDIYEIIKPSIGNPTVIGYAIFDEPMYGDYDGLRSYIDKFNQVANGMIPFVNLYPMYVAGGFGTDYDTYASDGINKIGLDYISVLLLYTSAFTLVNASDLSNNTLSTTKFKLNELKKVKAYIGGNPEYLEPDNDGVYTLSLIHI